MRDTSRRGCNGVLVCAGWLGLIACSSEAVPTSPSPTPPATSTPAPDPAPAPAPTGAVRVNDDFNGRTLFPADNWWNQDISGAPVDPQSDAFIDYVGRSRALHPDFGPPPYGIPYIGVGASEARTPVTFVDYGDESDRGAGTDVGYPIPDAARTQPNCIEGGRPGGGTEGDRHLILVDRDRWLLYELFAARWTGQRWAAGSGAVFDLSSNARRPDGWTSADAAGLAILPGLVRLDEAVRGPIGHALRMTVRRINGYVWPASHRAGSNAGALPMGARLRLKPSIDLSRYPGYVRNIFRAMQTHGLIVADHGSDMYITGAMDARWNNDELNPAFRALTAGDFEVIRLGWR
ncbi:MAG: hypothetical protein AB7N29_19960 [Vicinamibacterales bacterium]